MSSIPARVIASSTEPGKLPTELATLAPINRTVRPERQWLVDRARAVGAPVGRKRNNRISIKASVLVQGRQHELHLGNDRAMG